MRTFTPGSPAVYALAGMIAMAAAMGIGRFVYTPILPGMMQALGLSASDAGLVASANYAGYLVGAVLAAGSWGRGHERMIAIAGLGATSILALAMAMTDNVWLFVAIRFAAGVASAFVMIFLSTIVFARLAMAGRSDLQAWHFGGVGAGIAISSLLVGALLMVDWSWQAGWIASALVTSLAFLAVPLLVERSAPQALRPPPEPAMPGSVALTRIIIAYGLFGFGYIVTATFLVAIVRQSQAGELFGSAVWLVTGLAGLPSVWLWGHAVRRIGLAKVFAAGCLVEAVGVAASVSFGGHVGPLLGGVLLGGTFIAITAYGLQLGRQLAESAPRRVLAMMTAAFGVGQIAGPIVAGVVADRTGSFTAPSIIAALVLLVAAVLALIRPRAQSRPDSRDS